MFYSLNLGGPVRRAARKTPEVIPWRVVRDQMVNLQIVPDKTVFSGRAVESILYTFHSMYEGFMERVWYEGFCLVFKSRDFASFRIVYEHGRISFHLAVPAHFRSSVEHAVRNVWPKSTVREVPAEYLDRLDSKMAACAFLELKEHYFKSTLVDRSRLEPLPSLLAAGREIMPGDLAVLDVAFVPVSDKVWQPVARSARNTFRKGREPRKLPSKWSDLLFLLGDFLVDGVFEKVFGLFDQMFGDQKPAAEIDHTRAGRELRPSTEQKFTHPGFESVIRIVSQSDSAERAEKTLTAIGTAFKDLSADNEWEMRKVAPGKPTVRFVSRLVESKLPLVLHAANVVSVPEASQMLQLPSAPLQEEYPEIEQLSFREQRLPDSILDAALPGSVPLGQTTGVDPEFVNIPGGMSSSAKDDRCTPTVGIGGQGSGKTVFGTNQGIYWFGCHLSYENWKKNGRSVFLYDVTGGKTIRDFLEVCPPDRRHRVRVIDYGLADRRPPIGFSVPNVDPETAADLAAQTIEFLELVTEQTMGPQTNRWVTVHAIAAFEASSDNTPLEVVQSLTNDAFRVEKILPFVRNRSILRELAIFAAMSPEQRQAVVAPILNRFYKLTVSNPRLWECVAQRPLRDDSGVLQNDYRVFMDGDEEGPWAILINVPPADELGRVIQPSVQSAIMLAEASKLWAATLTRSPLDPNLSEFLVLYDEPHQFMRGTPFFKRMFREIRKYRGRPILLFHEWKAIRDPELAAAILGADPNLHILKGADANFQKLEAYVSPFTLDEFMAMPKYYAINRLKAGAQSYVFMCKLTPPGSEVLSLHPVDEFWRESAALMSRPVAAVRDDIFEREGAAFDAEAFANADSPAPAETLEADIECLRD